MAVRHCIFQFTEFELGVVRRALAESIGPFSALSHGPQQKALRRLITRIDEVLDSA